MGALVDGDLSRNYFRLKELCIPDLFLEIQKKILIEFPAYTVNSIDIIIDMIETNKLII